MATADGIQAFVETSTTKTTDEIDDQQSDAIRQYLSKKTAWISPNEEQFDALVNFLKKRLDEGHGETSLEIGTGGSWFEKQKHADELFIFSILVTDGESPGLLADEIEASIATLKSMQAVLDSEFQLLRKKPFANNTRFTHEYLIRRHIDQEDFMEVR